MKSRKVESQIEWTIKYFDTKQYLFEGTAINEMYKIKKELEKNERILKKTHMET